MSAKSYIVTGPMAIVNLDNGSAVHLMRNASVPSNVDPEHLQHLVDNGFVAEVGEFVGGLEPVYTGDLQKQVTAVDAEQLEDPKPFTAGSVDADKADADKVKDSDGGHAPARSAAKKST